MYLSACSEDFFKQLLKLIQNLYFNRNNCLVLVLSCSNWREI